MRSGTPKNKMENRAKENHKEEVREFSRRVGKWQGNKNKDKKEKGLEIKNIGGNDK